MRDFTFQEAATASNRFCADCGSEIHPRAEICPKCGVRQMHPGYRDRRNDFRYTPNRIVAALLAICIVGGFGAHKFYMGRSGAGMLYLLFFWTFFPFVFAFFEGLMYLFMSDDAFEERYWH